jgi:outer membrane protein
MKKLNARFIGTLALGLGLMSGSTLSFAGAGSPAQPLSSKTAPADRTRAALPTATAAESAPASPPSPETAPAAAPPTGAAPAAVERMSLDDVIRRARQVSPRLKQYGYLLDGAQARWDGAKSERRPQLDLTASYTRLSAVPELSAFLPPPQGFTLIFPNIQDRYAARLGVSVPIYTGGRLSNLVDAAAHDEVAAEKDLKTQEQDLVLEATNAYWELLTTRETEKVLKEGVATFQAHLNDAKNRERLGFAARNEVLQVQVERDQAEMARLEMENTARISEANLSRLLDLPPGTSIEPAQELLSVPAPSEDLETLVAHALGSRPDRAALLARAEASDFRVQASRADRLPQARITAGYDYANPNARLLPLEPVWNDSWDASVNFSFRVFDSGRTSAAVNQQLASAGAIRQQLQELDERIRFDVTGRLLDVGTATARIQLAEGNLIAAEENRRVAADRYRAGVIPSSELLDAEHSLLQAGLDRTTALAGQRVALSQLDRAVGR